MPIYVLVLAVLALSSPARMQAQDSPDATPVFHAGTNLVLVPTLVKTSKGEPVFALTADDFIVTDDGVPQKVTIEEDTDSQPLALVVVVETGGAGARRLDSYRKLGPLLDSLVGAVPHRVAVVSFDNQSRIEQEFTPEINDVAGALANLQPGDDGAAILDSLAYAIGLLRKQPPNYRRAILLFSETQDHGSQAKLEDALRAIDDTNTTIYSLGFSTTKADMKHEGGQFSSDQTPAPTHGCFAKDQSNGTETDSVEPSDGKGKGKGHSRAMQTYDCFALLAPPLRLAKMAVIAALDGMHRNVPETVAHLTGGEYYKFENVKNLERGLVTISNHVPNRYVLSFSPPADAAGLHAIDVRLKDRSGLQVEARKSYWADAPASP